MRRCLLQIVVALLFSAAAYPAVAQQLRVGVDFCTLFDNKEYESLSYDRSGTLFSARLTPKVGIVWSERNELMLGVDMLQDFGSGARFLTDADVQLYYAYRAPRVKVLMGIFPRSEMRGLREPLYFDLGYRYYNNRLAGVLVRYEGKHSRNSYVEATMDYTGIRTEQSRESFMLMFSGHHAVKAFYFGFDALVTHYGKDYNAATDDGVVDNLLATPYVGCNFNGGGFDFDFRLSYVQSLQRDRHFENRWEVPCGGELYCSISRWGVTLANRLYLGGGLLPLINRYGAELYHGLPLYATTDGIFESIALSYSRSFFDDTLNVCAGITAEHDGTGWGTRQWVQLGVKLNYDIELRRKYKE